MPQAIGERTASAIQSVTDLEVARQVGSAVRRGREPRQDAPRMFEQQR